VCAPRVVAKGRKLIAALVRCEVVRVQCAGVACAVGAAGVAGVALEVDARGGGEAQSAFVCVCVCERE